MDPRATTGMARGKPGRSLLGPPQLGPKVQERVPSQRLCIEMRPRSLQRGSLPSPPPWTAQYTVFGDLISAITVSLLHAIRDGILYFTRTRHGHVNGILDPFPDGVMKVGVFVGNVGDHLRHGITHTLTHGPQKLFTGYVVGVVS